MAMKSALFGLLLLTACSSTTGSFDVDVAETNAVGATLQLCGSESALTRTGTMFATEREITCEGHGRIEIALATGKLISCPIGYVTRHADPVHWHFAIEGGVCQIRR
jgi:hypothetical protein